VDDDDATRYTDDDNTDDNYMNRLLECLAEGLQEGCVSHSSPTVCVCVVVKRCLEEECAFRIKRDMTLMDTFTRVTGMQLLRQQCGSDFGRQCGSRG
jgi:hypothetical protein